MLNKFIVDDPEVCYLDGNSLGRLPKAAEERVREVVVEGWGKQLIGGWNADWIDLPQRLGAKISQIVGADADETIVADSTSINLFKLTTAALRLKDDRRAIVTDSANFPSDLYILESAMQAAGGERCLRVIGDPEQILISTDEIIAGIERDTALVCLSHVAYKSGQLYDMAAITTVAHQAGALVLWDLSHSVGAVPIDLHRANVDLAVGCTYKYLCGGPGAPAFLFCRRNLQAMVENPIAGWFSHAAPFQFDPKYQAAIGIDKFLTGTPPVISLAAIEAGVDLVLAAGIENIRQRSILLSTRLLDGIKASLLPLGFQLRSPEDASERGSHISLAHPEARRITENLIQRHRVIPDFRTPDNLRLGIAPLYTTEREIDRAIDGIEQTVRDQEFQSIELPASPVT